ncbi:uncharacterized protein [Haliotis cracherodii]|uniref:uncharacterized protein isoform X2 n=1 Tax=Haliotis cracherodii TaxID=6455 RepID=UPI0039EB1A2F
MPGASTFLPLLLLSGVCSVVTQDAGTRADNVFLVAFFPESVENPIYGLKNHLFLASRDPGSCAISYDDGRRKTSTVQLPGNDVVPFDVSGMTGVPHGAAVINKGILVNCTTPISAYAYTYGHSYGSCDAYTSLPITSEFTDYTVPSVRNNAVLGIVALQDETRVTVALNSTCNYSLNGTTFTSGDTISTDLESLDVLSLSEAGLDGDNSRTCDLGGTRVTSSAPVALYSGATMLKLLYDGGHAMAQVPPTKLWSQHFVVPSLKGKAVGHELRVTADSDGTRVMFTVPGQARQSSVDLDAGEYVDMKFGKDDNVIINSSNPIQVMQFMEHYFKSFEMAIPGTDAFKNNFIATTVDRNGANYNSFVNVVTRQVCKNDIVVEGSKPYTLSWTDLGTSGFTVGSVSVSPGTILARSSGDNCSFSLHVYGYGTPFGESYGYNAGYIWDTPIHPTTTATETTTALITPQPMASTLSTPVPTPPTPSTTTATSTVTALKTSPTNRLSAATETTSALITPQPMASTLSTPFPTPPTPSTTTATTTVAALKTSATETTTVFLTPQPMASTLSTPIPTPPTPSTTTATTTVTALKTSPTNSLSAGELLNQAVTFTCRPGGWMIDVDLDKMKALVPDIDPNMVFMSNNMCRGDYNSEHSLLTFNYTYKDCNTDVKETANNIIYKNFLFYPEMTSTSNVIDSIIWQYDLECNMKRDEVDHLEYNPHVAINIHSHGNNDVHGHEAKIAFYNDSNFQNEIKGKPLSTKLGAEIFVKVTSPAHEANVMVVKDCYAIAADNSTVKYPLMEDRCVKDPHAAILDSTRHEFRFSFKTVEFLGDNADVDVSCDVHFCSDGDNSIDCQQKCH